MIRQVQRPLSAPVYFYANVYGQYYGPFTSYADTDTGILWRYYQYRRRRVDRQSTWC